MGLFLCRMRIHLAVESEEVDCIHRRMRAVVLRMLRHELKSLLNGILENRRILPEVEVAG